MDALLAALDIELVDSVTVANLSGEIDLSNARSIGRRISEAAAGGSVVIDISQLGYLDSAGIAMIHAIACEVGCRIVAAADSTVRRTLSIAGLDTVIPIDSSRQTAIDALRSGEGKPV